MFVSGTLETIDLESLHEHLFHESTSGTGQKAKKAAKEIPGSPLVQLNLGIATQQQHTGGTVADDEQVQKETISEWGNCYSCMDNLNQNLKETNRMQ